MRFRIGLLGALAAVAVAACGPADAPLAPLPGATPFPPDLARRIASAARERDRRDPPRTRHRDADGRPRYTNRLILETSPYLIQHAHNPVDWHPWGDEAFETARREGKPVLLSIGYSTCHWCHVMEEESYEDEEIAAYLNAHFVAIKVDREERPDVDGVYMDAVQAMTGGGGWPLNVWLTPDRRPFWGGTYFPPRDGVRGGGPGFLTVLRTLADVYTRDPARAASAAADVAGRLAAAAPAAADVPGSAAIRAAVATLAAGFDAEWGGFGRAPKFPRPATLELLLRHHRRTGDARSLAMVVTTLERMAAGGIHDQLGGGFHRYATDATWRVPHFEKMLYDNAELAVVYLEAYQVTGREDFAAVARDTLDWVARDLAAPEGGFYAAMDADSPGGEGAYFRWTPAEIDVLLGPERGRVVRAFFDVRDGEPEGSVLWRPPGREADEATVAAARAVLLAARARRPAPAVDRKVIVAWNGLALSAFARAALVLDDARYLAIARRTAERLTATPALPHELVDGRPAGDPFLDDYAFLVAGLLDLFEADADPRWLRRAIDLQAALDADFADASHGGWFFTGARHEALLTRAKPAEDGALPAGNSMAAHDALRLAELTSEDRYRERAEAAFRAFGGTLARAPGALPRMLVALDFLLDRPKEVIVVAPAGGDAAGLLAVVRRTFAPNRVLVSAPEDRVAALGSVAPVAAEKPAIGGRATAYVCEARRCALPATEPDVLARQLAAVAPLP